MTETNGSNGQAQPSTFAEAPASINLRFSYKNYHGIQLTLRANSGQEVLRKLDGALAKLDAMGATPSGGSGPPQSQGENGNARTCQYHGPMKKSKYGDDYFCPVKMADGTYCQEKSK